MTGLVKLLLELAGMILGHIKEPSAKTTQRELDELKEDLAAVKKKHWDLVNFPGR